MGVRARGLGGVQRRRDAAVALGEELELAGAFEHHRGHHRESPDARADGDDSHARSSSSARSLPSAAGERGRRRAAVFTSPGASAMSGRTPAPRKPAGRARTPCAAAARRRRARSRAAGARARRWRQSGRARRISVCDRVLAVARALAGEHVPAPSRPGARRTAVTSSKPRPLAFIQTPRPSASRSEAVAPRRGRRDRRRAAPARRCATSARGSRSAASCTS